MVINNVDFSSRVDKILDHGIHFESTGIHQRGTAVIALGVNDRRAMFYQKLEIV